MALNLIVAPEPVAPEDLDDYVAQNNLTEALNLNIEQPLRVISGNIPESAVLQVGGAIYRADSDTAITGGTTDYVKITPAGATASASYVADLTGVTWNKTYNGYYDVSGNLYIFNEMVAIAAGEIASVFSRFLMKEANGDVIIGGGGTFLKFKVIDIGDWNMDTTTDVSVAHGLTLANIRSINILIRDDDDTPYLPFPGTLDSDTNVQASATNIRMERADSSFFNSAEFNSTSFNRGWITIWYVA